MDSVMTDKWKNVIKRNTFFCLLLPLVAALSACELTKFNKDTPGNGASSNGNGSSAGDKAKEKELPTVLAQSFATTDDAAFAVELSVSDQKLLEGLVFEIVDQPVHGVLTGVAPDLVYTPTPPYSGQDSFTVQISDGKKSSAVATILIAVTHANHAPHDPMVSCVLSPLGLSVLNACSVLNAELADADGDVVTYVDDASTCPNLSLDGMTGIVSFSAPARNESCEIKIKAFDGLLYSNSMSSGVVTASNNPPQAPLTLSCEQTAVPAGSTLNHCALTPVDPLDLDGDAVTYLAEASSTCVITSVDPTSGEAYFTAPAKNATCLVKVIAFDGVDYSAPVVSQMISGLNNNPSANSSSIDVSYNVPKAVTLTGSDADGDSFTYSLGTGPSHGALSGTIPSLVYTPTSGYQGADSFTFTVSGGGFDSAEATVALTVHEPIVITPNPAHVIQNGTLALTASGASGAVHFEVTSGTGIVDPATGVFSAPGSLGQSVVTATDEIGATALVNITTTLYSSASPFTLTANCASPSYSGGTGSALTPYLISEASQLPQLGCASQLNVHFKLSADIDLYGYSLAPIGSDTAFQGHLDGDNHVISFWTWVAQTGVPNSGLFAQLGSGALVENLGFEYLSLDGVAGAGGIVGVMSGATIIHSHTSGEIRHGCSYDNATAGGIAAAMTNSSIQKSYSSVNISCGYMAGGLVGYLSGSSISDSYSTGSVQSFSSSGTFISDLEGGSTITRSYSVGSAFSGMAFVGYLGSGTSTNSFWDTDTSGTIWGRGATGASTAQMMTQSLFTDAGWDFTNTWTLSAGSYPVLR